MNAINPNKTGLVLGALLGLFHLAWALLVAVGWAQPLMDFIFSIHFIKPPYEITPFNIGTAAILILVTFVSGYVTGSVFSLLWNKLHK